jgi:hypothetical protein
MLLYATLAAAGTRRTYSPEDRQIAWPLSVSTSIAVIFTIVTVFLGVLGQRRGAVPAVTVPVIQSFGALLYLGVLVVYLLVIGRYRLLELDLRVRRNIQYLVISSAWTAAIVAAGVWLWWRLMHVELVLPNVRLTQDALEVMPTPMEAVRNDVFEKGVLIAGAVVLAYAFRALLKRGHRFLAEQYYQGGYDYRRAAREFGEVMGPRMDLDGLAEGLLTVMHRLMPVKRAGVVFVQGDRLVSSKRSIGFDGSDWDIFCAGCVEDAVSVLRGARGGEREGELDTEYAPPRLRLALRKAQVHYLYPIGGHDELRGVIFVGEKLSEAAYTADDFAFLGAVAGQASLLVENAFLYENLAAQERVRQELAIARRIQLESLPQRAPRVTGLDVAGVSVPAQEVGGDYFDYLEGTEGRLGVMIGDVSGKGTSAALYMSKLQGIVRSLHGFGLPPRQLLVRTNDLLGRDMEKRAFVTVLGAFFDTHTREVTVVRGGHRHRQPHPASRPGPRAGRGRPVRRRTRGADGRLRARRRVPAGERRHRREPRRRPRGVRRGPARGALCPPGRGRHPRRGHHHRHQRRRRRTRRRRPAARRPDRHRDTRTRVIQSSEFRIQRGANTVSPAEEHGRNSKFRTQNSAQGQRSRICRSTRSGGISECLDGVVPSCPSF